MRAVLQRGVWIVLAAGAVTLLWGCGGSSPSAIDPHSPQARHIAGLFWLMLWIAAGIYAVVLGLVLVSLRARRRSDTAARPTGAEVDEWTIPSSNDAATTRRGTRFIIGGGLVLPIVVLIVVGVATVRTTNAVQGGASVVKIHVEAERWWWRLTYPDDHVVTANEIHVPVGEPVDLTLTSDNVIHSLWVPELNGKTDVIPGQTNHMTFTADAPGTYRGQCAEFCGIGHALMAFLVIAESPADYAQWVRTNSAPAATPPDGAAAKGSDLFVSSSCAGCHTVAGTAASGTIGPDLTHLGSRATIGSDTLPNTPTDLAHWLADTQGVKRGALMPQIDLTTAQIADLVAYLESLK
ncbi:MAG: cytochrome c oxidase subunit II [Ilumatobacteraceae bacterium]